MIRTKNSLNNSKNSHGQYTETYWEPVLSDIRILYYTAENGEKKKHFLMIQDTHLPQCGKRKNSMKPTAEEYKDTAEKELVNKFIRTLILNY